MPPLPQPRIGFVLSSLKFGGGERVALNLARALADRGYAIDILLMQAIGELLPEAERDYRVIDLRCARTWQLPFKLAHYLRAEHPVALISSFWRLNLCACLARIARPATRLALWEHSPPSRSNPGWLYGLSASLIYRLATCVVAVSSGVSHDVLRLTRGLRRRVHVIHNPVPVPPGARAIRPPNGDAARRLIWIGRLDHPKNPALMIRAFAHLPRAAYRLVMLGDGPQRADLEALAASLGIAAQVDFPGFQTDPYAFLAKADLLVLSSDREGLPTVMIEALHAGRGIVATDCGEGVREILANGAFGEVVPMDDPAALAAGIEREAARQRDSAQQRRGGQRFLPDRIVLAFMTALRLDSEAFPPTRAAS